MTDLRFPAGYEYAFSGTGFQVARYGDLSEIVAELGTEVTSS
jgi:hypothetical protein